MAFKYSSHGGIGFLGLLLVISATVLLSCSGEFNDFHLCYKSNYYEGCAEYAIYPYPIGEDWTRYCCYDSAAYGPELFCCPRRHRCPNFESDYSCQVNCYDGECIYRKRNASSFPSAEIPRRERENTNVKAT